MGMMDTCTGSSAGSSSAPNPLPRVFFYLLMFSLDTIQVQGQVIVKDIGKNWMRRVSLDRYI